MAIVACPSCGSKNRVDEARSADGSAKCGKCGTALPISSGPVIVTDANFALAVEGVRVPVLLDCWAAWCPPCRAIAPVIEQLARESLGRWRIGKLDVDANPVIARQFKIESIPTLLVFKSGKVFDRLVGAHPRQAMEAALLKAL